MGRRGPSPSAARLCLYLCLCLCCALISAQLSDAVLAQMEKLSQMMEALDEADVVGASSSPVTCGGALRQPPLCRVMICMCSPLQSARGVVACQIGLLFYASGALDTALEWYSVGLGYDSTLRDCLFNSGVALERQGVRLASCPHFVFAPCDHFPLFPCVGKILESASMYNTILRLNPGDPQARLNIAALHHSFGVRQV